MLARGGLRVSNMKTLENIRSRGGLSQAQVNSLEQLKARGGLTKKQVEAREEMKLATEALQGRRGQFELKQAEALSVGTEEEKARYLDQLRGGRTEQEWTDFIAAQTGMMSDKAERESIARGGLTSEQRLSEIRASQEGSNLNTLTQLMSNPAALGTLMASGGGEGLIARLQGMQADGGEGTGILDALDEAAGGDAGGGVLGGLEGTTGVGTRGLWGEGIGALLGQGNITLADLIGSSQEQREALAGAKAAQGITPDMLMQLIQGRTPGGSSQAGVFSGGGVV